MVGHLLWDMVGAEMVLDAKVFVTSPSSFFSPSSCTASVDL